MPATFDPSPASPALATLIAPVMAIIFAGFLIIGLALPVLPRYVHGALGFGSVAVGWVTGAQFTASLLLRLPAAVMPIATAASAQSSSVCSGRWRAVVSISAHGPAPPTRWRWRCCWPDAA